MPRRTDRRFTESSPQAVLITPLLFLRRVLAESPLVLKVVVRGEIGSDVARLVFSYTTTDGEHLETHVLSGRGKDLAMPISYQRLWQEVRTEIMQIWNPQHVIRGDWGAYLGFDTDASTNVLTRAVVDAVTGQGTHDNASGFVN